MQLADDTELLCVLLVFSAGRYVLLWGHSFTEGLDSFGIDVVEVRQSLNALLVILFEPRRVGKTESKRLRKRTTQKNRLNFLTTE